MSGLITSCHAQTQVHIQDVLYCISPTNSRNTPLQSYKFIPASQVSSVKSLPDVDSKNVLATQKHTMGGYYANEGKTLRGKCF